MKKILTLTALGLIFFTIPSSIVQAQWVTQNSGFTSNINAVYFHDSNTGYAVGDNSRIYKTINGGLSWNSAVIPGVNVILESVITARKSGTGLATGRNSIFVSTNGGANWMQHAFEDNLRIKDIGENDAGILFAAAYELNNNEDTIVFCRLLKSTNGGNNWSVLPGITIDEPGVHINGLSLTFPDSNTGYVATVKGIYRTTNGGYNFTQVDGRRTFTIDNAGPTTIMAGVSVGNGLFIIKSDNAGANWVQLHAICNPCLGNKVFSSMRVLPTVNKIYVTVASTNSGFDFLQQDSSVFVSTNSGVDWFYQSLPVTGINIYSVNFIDGNTGWLAGSNGTILKTTNGGGEPIGIKPISSGIPEKFFLHQNYPNPFNPSTKIKFTVSNSHLKMGQGGDIVNLIVYDVLGREIKTLLNEKLNPGTYEVEWDASDFPSGIYFYKIVIDSHGESVSFVDTKKMILMK